MQEGLPSRVVQTSILDTPTKTNIQYGNTYIPKRK